MNFNKITDTFTLKNGIKIPCVGFGTWQSADGDECYKAVLSALRCGYRHIDTATAYGNEESVGKAISDFLKESGVSRSELFITTKLWNPDHGYEKTKVAIELSLKKLGLEYIDLYLIHWPNPVMYRECWALKNAESWRAMEEAYNDGKLKALGISNFCERHIEELEKTAVIAPVVNQIKLCPGQPQTELVEYCKAKGMILEGYSPMGTGGIFNNKEMALIAEKYNRSVAQVCIRWSLQMGFLPLPKSVTESRIAENAGVFDFDISPEDLKRISNLQCEEIKKARNPDEAPF